MIILKSADEIRRCGRLDASLLKFLELLRLQVEPGVTSGFLDRLAEQECKKRKARPAFKGYGGFPFTICASPNEKVVHGFADEIPLR